MNVAILTISDTASRGKRQDLSGPALAKMISNAGWNIVSQDVIPDERSIISERLQELVSSSIANLILTTGGTGLSPRDVTPEATLDIIERRVPGIPEAMRAKSLCITSRAMLSRAEAGVAGDCLILNLPGSPKGAVECFEAIANVIPHAVELITGTGGECAQ